MPIQQRKRGEGKNKYTGFRFSPKTLETLHEIARQQNKSLNLLITEIVEQYISDQNKLSKLSILK